MSNATRLTPMVNGLFSAVLNMLLVPSNIMIIIHYTYVDPLLASRGDIFIFDPASANFLPSIK
jgi:hypothetical protein